MSRRSPVSARADVADRIRAFDPQILSLQLYFWNPGFDPHILSHNPWDRLGSAVLADEPGDVAQAEYHSNVIVTNSLSKRNITKEARNGLLIVNLQSKWNIINGASS